MCHLHLHHSEESCHRALAAHSAEDRAWPGNEVQPSTFISQVTCQTGGILTVWIWNPVLFPRRSLDVVLRQNPADRSVMSERELVSFEIWLSELAKQGGRYIFVLFFDSEPFVCLRPPSGCGV